MAAIISSSGLEYLSSTLGFPCIFFSFSKIPLTSFFIAHPLKNLRYFFSCPRVEYISPLLPALAGRADAVEQIGQPGRRVRIGVDGYHDALLFGHFEVSPIDVKTIRTGVQFENHVMSGCHLNNVFHIYVIPVTSQEKPACRMAKYGH